jgi:hypothetical protein
MDRGGMQKIAICSALVAFCLLATSPARAEIKLDPGTWQQVESGSEDGKPAEPVTYTDCLTPEQAKDPIKALSDLKNLASLVGQHCKTMQVKQDANTVAVDFACGDEASAFIGINLKFTFADARHYTGTVKSIFVFKGKKTTSDKTIEAKWLDAACKKEKE